MSQATTKKRKHAPELEKPRKKKAVDSSSTNVKISHIRQPSEEPGLIIASGEGLAVPEKIKFKAYQKLSDGQDEAKDLLLQSSEHSSLNFIAREREEGAPPDLVKHYVGIFDPERNELQLVQAKHVSVRKTVKDEETAQEEENETGAAARRALGMEFGTKKAKKAIAQGADNRAVPNDKKQGKGTSAASALLSMLEEDVGNAPTMEAMNAETNAAKPRPKHNIDAKTPEDAYTVDGVVGKDMMQSLRVKPWWEAITQREDAVEVPSRYASKRIEPLAKADNIEMLKLTKYVVVLINFLNECTFKGKPAKRIPKREVLRENLGERDDLISKLIDRFTNNGKFTPWHVDLVRTTVAVLTLILDGFETDILDIREDLGLKAPEMNKYFAEVGAKVKPLTEEQRGRVNLSKAEASVHGIAKLKTPLEFPKPRAIPSRRR